MPTSVFGQLLPCPHQVVSLHNATIPGIPGHVLNSTVSESLGLPPRTPDVPHRQMEEQTAESNFVLKEGRASPERKLVSLEISRGHSDVREETSDGLFDVSVLCTVFTDLRKLFADGTDARLVDALLWNTKVTYQRYWSVHIISV